MIGGNYGPFFQAAAIPMRHNPSQHSAGADSIDEEVLDYTVYKSKIEFERLRLTIKNRETVASLVDVLLLVLFGIIEIVVYIVAEIVSPMPVLVAISLHMRGHQLEPVK